MICSTCQSENPDSNRFCGNCGNRLQDSASPADPRSSTEARASENRKSTPSDPANNTSVRRPFIVSTTGLSSEFSSSRVTVPSRPLSTSTYTGYGSQLKPRVEETAHIEPVIEAVPAPVDPADEPIFSGAPAIAEHPRQEDHASRAWLEQNVASPRIAESEDDSASIAERESQSSADVEEAPRSGSILGLSYPIAVRESRVPERIEPSYRESEQIAERREEQREQDRDEIRARETDAVVHQPISEPEVPETTGPAFVYDEPVKEEMAPAYHDDRNSFFQFDDTGDHRSADVSGPSFLGLGSPTANDYLLEDEAPPSHWRRNLFLIIVLIFVGLGVMEWRASQNGDSTSPMDVLHLKLPKKKGKTVDPSVAPPSSDNSSGAANNGKPDMVIEPNKPPAQTTQNKPADTGADNSSSQPPAKPESKPDSNAGTADTGASQNKPADTATPIASSSASKPTTPAPAPETPEQAAKTLTPEPKPAPLKQVAKATPPPAKPAPSKPAATPSRAVAKPTKPAPTPEPDSALSGGSAELQKGIAAGPTELGRMWLWKAMGKGNGEAPVLLADMYAQGKGVPKDCEQAMLLLNAAAKKANPRARSKLGSMYAAGECVARDRVQAYKWMSAALQVNPGSEWLEKNRETLMNQMSPAERRRAEAYR